MGVDKSPAELEAAVAATVELELWVMATINMPGLHVGELALVDPRVPYIANALEHRYLVAVDDPTTNGGTPA